MHNCISCGSDKVIWDNDFSFEDFCFEGDGIVSKSHCSACGAVMFCLTSSEDPDEDEET